MDEGKTFSNPVRLSMSNGASIPYVAAFDNNVYVVWGELIGDRPRVFLTSSRDGGMTFSPPTIISGSLYGWPGGLAALDHRVHVLFNGAPAVGGPAGDVYSTVSTDTLEIHLESRSTSPTARILVQVRLSWRLQVATSMPYGATSGSQSRGK